MGRPVEAGRNVCLSWRSARRGLRRERSPNGSSGSRAGERVTEGDVQCGIERERTGSDARPDGFRSVRSDRTGDDGRGNRLGCECR